MENTTSATTLWDPILETELFDAAQDSANNTLDIQKVVEILIDNGYVLAAYTYTKTFCEEPDQKVDNIINALNKMFDIFKYKTTPTEQRTSKYKNVGIYINVDI